MAKHTLKILRYEHRKIFTACLATFNFMHERVKIICETNFILAIFIFQIKFSSRFSSRLLKRG